MFKLAIKQVFDTFNVNLRKNEGFLTSMPCNPIPDSHHKYVLYCILLKINIFQAFIALI